MGRPATDLTRCGCRQDEFFVEGMAHAYGEVAGTELGRDGLWQLEARGTSPYVTRMIVVRPEVPPPSTAP